MSIITKAAAKEVALKLTDKKAKMLTDLQREFEEYCTDLTEAATPKKVLELFKTHPNYLSSFKHVYFSGEGIAHSGSKKLTRPIPRAGSNVNLEPEEARAYMKKLHSLEDAKLQYEKLLIDTESALLGLKSYKKISECFPEATPFLPNKISTTLVVDISKLRGRLK